MNDDIARIVIGFHLATDGGLPVDCSGVEGLSQQLAAWCQNKHANAVESAGAYLEGYLIDEVGIEAIAEFMSTVSSENYPTILSSLKKSIEEFHGGPDIEDDGDSESEAAISTLARISELQSRL